MSFVHLQVISAYSLLQSTTRLEDLVRNAKEKGYQSIALTDLNYLHGQVDFFKLCQKEKIKPLIGMQLEMKGVVQKEHSFPIVLIAKNYQGYQKLMSLSTLHTLEKEPFRLKEALTKGMEQLIGITPGEKGEVESFLSQKEFAKAEETAVYWKDIFPEGQFYLGLQLHRNMQSLIEPLQKLAEVTDIPLTAMHDVRYLEPEDHFSCRVLQAIGNSEQIHPEEEEKRGSYYLPSAEEISQRYAARGLEDLVKETVRIADSVSIDLPLHQSLLPKFPLPEGADTRQYLQQLCEKGLQERVGNPDESYRERLQHELAVIHEMGFDDYFLIVWDLMDYARKAQILPGAGRGSAAGSLVAYVLQITHVDPLQHDLLFERFLNKERYNMPDIDLDFPDDRRDEMLRYVKNKYGQDHVAQIMTFGTLAAKMSLRDTARVFGLDPAEASQWSNAVPNQVGIRLSQAYQASGELRNLAAASPRNQLLFETAQKIEGVPRHISTHAAGVVISDRPLVELIPLQQKGNELYLTQYTMGNIEEIGLLKMDFLGLKNLTILNDAVLLAEKETRQRIDVFSFPLDDPETMKLFQQADTNGIFQFESPGIKNVLRKLGPETMEDLAAVNALFRPGPMEQIDTFIDRKKGKIKVAYPHPILEPILKVTYGVMVYQEQVMQAASRMAGFSLGEADLLRRAIGKKQRAALDRERKHFVEGAVDKGHPAEKATEVYDYIERFANYGFNRSHSVAYSYIAYQMAYMKTHYPEAFFAALLNSVNPHSEKMKEYVLDIKKRNLKLVYPDINTSGWRFSLAGKQIQYGLNGIKGLRRDFISDFLKERKRNGTYQDFIQFLRRLPEKWLKTETITPLIVSGVFDSFGYNRATLLQSLPGMLASIQYSGNNIDLFQVLEPKYVLAEELPKMERLELEEEFLGLSLMGHPVDEFESLYQEDQIVYIAELGGRKTQSTMGMLKDIKRIQTKKGETMAFLTVSDSTGLLDVTVFPEQYRKIMKDLKKDILAVFSGKLDNRKQQDRQTFILQSLIPIDSYLKNRKAQQTCYIRIPEEKGHSDTFIQMESLLLQFPGEQRVILVDEKHNKKILMDRKYWITPTETILKQLRGLLGSENIVLK